MGHLAQSAPLPEFRPTGRISVEDEMTSSYIDYAMSVIVSRALPDVRDGQKPVHRRIIYAAKTGGFRSDKKHVKSAKVVGETMGNFHPHGDSAIYEALVRMGQWFSMRVPLIDGQGNFGSPDGDNPAAMRYTESRLAKISDDALIADVDEGTVDWRPNYDESLMEPKVLPARFPALLVNGGEGIAVGMATKMAPHNLGEVIDGTFALMDNPGMDVEAMMKIIQGPDFPTGGVIHGKGGIRDAYEAGRGSVSISSVHAIEQMKGGRTAIVITEIPYQVSRAALTKRIDELANDKTIEGVLNVRDESDVQARIVIELKRDANVELLLNHLRKNSDFTKGFSINATCLDSHGDPRVMGLLDILHEFIAFRRLTIRRRTEFRLNKRRAELETQVGLFAARGMVDEVVRRIRASGDRDSARAAIMSIDFPCEGEFATLLHEVDPDVDLPAVFRLSEAQAKTILELRLQNLTALEQDAIALKAREMLAAIRTLLEILNDPQILDGVMRTEMAEIRAKYATPRLTRIESADASQLTDDDYVEDKPVVLTMTRQGYVKLTALDAYREQSRGGKGKTGMDTKDDDFVTTIMECSTRTMLIFFTSRGIAHTLKAYRLPEVAAHARGRPIINMLQGLRQGETIAAVMAMPDAAASAGRYMLFVTDKGDVRRNDASDFASVNKAGKIAMKLEDDNGHSIADLIAVLECGEDDDVVLATRRGKAVRYPVTESRVHRGRSSTGSKGITLQEGNVVLSAAIVRHCEVTAQERDAYFEGGTATWNDDAGNPQSLTLTPEKMAEMAEAEQTLLTVTALGYGKRFSSHDFRTTGRGTQGVFVGQFGPITGDLVACFPVVTSDGIMLVTNGGQAIRTRCSEIRVMGRTTRGVRLFNLPAGQSIVGVARLEADGRPIVPTAGPAADLAELPEFDDEHPEDDEGEATE